MTIAITGATGQLGQLAISHLQSHYPDHQVIALVRDQAKATHLGVQTRYFDYSKPETLQPALTGVTQLLLISGSEVGSRIEQHRHVIKAAVAAGVQKIVYTSLLHADTSHISLADEHRATEADIKASGIPYTILRNSWYSENYTAAIPAVLENGALIGAAGEGKLSTAPRKDYAEAAVVVLCETGHENKTYELAGDQAYTLTDLAAEISRQSGQDIPYHHLAEADYANILATIGLPETVATMIAGADVAAADGALFDDSKQLSRLIGHATTPIADVVAEALAQ